MFHLDSELGPNSLFMKLPEMCALYKNSPKGFVQRQSHDNADIPSSTVYAAFRGHKISKADE